jgi:probable addiction module antidote protein
MQSNFERSAELKAFDASEFLSSPEDCAAYLQEFLNDEEDQALLFSAIGDVLKAQRRMSQASRELGLSREGLYKSLSEKGNPSFHTVVHTLKLLGLSLSVHPADAKDTAAA